ncbi:hypothetical protein PWT90_02600 [Aphanocladium album]|nr:hypothetical protein PWT90_02600 [Aphanocladium album]
MDPKNSAASGSTPSYAGKGNSSTTADDNAPKAPQTPFKAPQISLPKGGGAMKSIGEKFSVSPATGTGNFLVPISTSPGRGESGIKLALSYNSGGGNGPFGVGWQLSSQSISRKTDKGLPLYHDEEYSDVFVLSDTEDLVPVKRIEADGKLTTATDIREIDGVRWQAQRYQPRIESGFLRIIKLTNMHTLECYWEIKTDSNVTTIFGDSDESRVSNPLKPTDVFQWLPSTTFDDKGNETRYEYKEEDISGNTEDRLAAHVDNANGKIATKYIKRIKYGNTVSRLSSEFPANNDWMFEVVFDYGEHNSELPSVQECEPWRLRHDPFSSRRAGFNIPVFRLCSRVLMFHHFPGEPGIGRDCLVSSLSISYSYSGEDPTTGFAVMAQPQSATQYFWRRTEAGYECDCMPSLEFRYSKAQPAKQSHPLHSSSLRNIPAGLSGSYQLVDLEGQGLPGVVLRIEGALQYVPNLGDGKFGSAVPLPSNPSAVFKAGSEGWMDLSGGGKTELVQLSGTNPGFYKLNWDEDSGWDSFQSFESFPNVDMADKRVQLIDLTGDGVADIVITGDDKLTYYCGLGDRGFGSPNFEESPLDHDSESRLVFWDGVEAIYTADMTGDGLTDLVRVRSGQVAYWPNLGYGRFSHKVLMANAPVFDHPELFDQSHLRLADVDGSGTTDIIYLAGDVPTIYHNLAGNGWSSGTPIFGFPGIDSTINVQVSDLLGRGTACLIWSSVLPGDFGSQIRYLDLMEAGKPYLLVEMVNNMGWETRLSYECSTKFFLRDKAAGDPWTTRLPFPVQCIEKSEVVDRVSKNLFTTRYRYHGGCFDGVEREFRGFAMVESLDTEIYSGLQDGKSANISKQSNLPPVLTKTWYSTGQYLDGNMICKYPEIPYWSSGELSARGDANFIQCSAFPQSITTHGRSLPYAMGHEERMEACRALRGQMLRSEVYAMDGSKLESLPYLIKEANMQLELRQPRSNNHHAVFFVRPKEAVEVVYDRKSYSSGSLRYFDPRISHTLTLETDFYGNPLSSIVISYGRQSDDLDSRLHDEDKEAQRKTYAVWSTNSSTNGIDIPEAYLLPRQAESQTYELINIAPCRDSTVLPVSERLVPFHTAAEITRQLSSGKFDIPFENLIGPYPSNTNIFRRLLKNFQTLYRRDSLEGPLALGVMESLGLPLMNLQLVLTDEQAKLYADESLIPPDEIGDFLENECKFTRVSGRSGWWVPSGVAYFAPDRDATPAEELQQARDHFFLIRRSRSQFDTPESHSETFYDFDSYDMLIQEARDPYGNRVTVGERHEDPSQPLVKQGHDYRLLVPFLSMDSNGNRSQVAFDVLGNVVASAAMGNPEEQLGDSVNGVRSSLSEDELIAYFSDPASKASNLLASATNRTVYDFFAYYRTRHHDKPQPNWVSSITRETHDSDLSQGAKSRVFTTFSYSDGLGRSIQTKSQCEPGDVPKLLGGDAGRTICRAEKRWLTSAWTIFNNKNNPVKQFEPLFSDTHMFQNRAIHGISKVILYDAVARPVAVLYPDHTWTKAKFDPWAIEEWDKQDTIMIADPSADPDVGPFFKLLPRQDYTPTWYEQRRHGQRGHRERQAAEQSASLSRTPTTKFFDALGRPCVTFDVLRKHHPGDATANAPSVVVRQPVFLDIQGLAGTSVDALQRTVARNVYSIAGWVISETSMDGGTKWTIPDAVGSPLLTKNARGDVFRTKYDRSRRLVGLSIVEDGTEFLVEKCVYGETDPETRQQNARGRIVRAFDQSGVIQTPRYDFKGNLIQCVRQLTSSYKGTIDWSKEDVALEPATYAEALSYDALGKPTKTTLPDGTRTLYKYNERGLTESVQVTTPGSDVAETVISNIEYDAKGQRTVIKHGNGVESLMSYDDKTFRITRILTLLRRRRLKSKSPSHSPSRGKQPSTHVKTECLQDLNYIYDALGNISHAFDDATQVIFFRNHKVEASQRFIYDSLGRLVEATGREHVGQMYLARDRHAIRQTPTRANSPQNNTALGRYAEYYEYDAVNNLQSLRHVNLTEERSQTRRYFYKESSQVHPEEFSNRLSYTTIGDAVEEYRYDNSEKNRGHMTSMPGIPHMSYDYADRMVCSGQTSDKSGDMLGKTYYRYDATGKRVRKVVEKQSLAHGSLISKETIYIGGAYEILRKPKTTQSEDLEVESTRIIESGRQLLLIETVKRGGDDAVGTARGLYRYQLGNYQGSAAIEVDQDGQILSYEEYTPYGISTVKSLFRETAVPKRYRFLGKEKDESGLYHFGLRYYASWLGRFISADPKGGIDGSNLYQYSHGNPTMLADPGGTAASPAPVPLETLGWTGDAMRSRGRDWVVFSNLPGWVSGLREWRIYGRLAAGDFAHMLQNQYTAAGGAAADVAVKMEQYMPNAKTGQRLGSSFIDFMFPALKQAYEHKLMDFEKYSEEGVLVASKVREAFGGSDGIVAQLEKHTANVAAKFGKGWGQTQLAVTIRGVERTSPEWTAMTNQIKAIMQKAGQLEPLIAHASDPGIMAARSRLDAAAIAFVNKAGGLAKYVGKGSKALGPLGALATVVLAPVQAHAMANPNETKSNRTQAGLDLGSGVTGLGVAAIATKSAAITATGGATAAAAAGVVVAGAALGGAAAGAALGGYVADKVEGSEWAQKNLGETGAAVAASTTGVLAGAAAGAAVGALVGSALPIVGTLAGAAIGGAAGAIGASAKILISRYWD